MFKNSKCIFHHVGVACRNLDEETIPWLLLGYSIDEDRSDFEDPIQKIRGRFIVGAGPRLELLMPTSSDSPIITILSKGIKYYHQAFMVSSFENAVYESKNMGFKMITKPSPAVAFNGRLITFFLMQNMHIIELIEMEKT
jgi:methylmalonyl-CoA/ethylmalonyl-CoA epimerase